MKNVYIECSMLAASPSVKTGIQRVVRHVIQKSSMIDGLHVTAVDLSFGNFAEVNPALLSPPEQNNTPKPTSSSGLLGIKKGLRRLLRYLEPYPVVVAGLYRGYTLFRRMYRHASGGKCLSLADALSHVTADDHLIILDASWTRDIWSGVREFRARGGRVTVVVYDLIPLTHPEFCEPDHVACFSDWMRNVTREADVCVGISRFVRDEVRGYLKGLDPVRPPKTDFFYLGADLLQLSQTASEPRLELVRLFGSRPVYIMVSTIEPRKNHALVLKAFEQLWRQGVDVSLVIIGRSGWKVEALLDTISQHEENGQRLFHFSDLTDCELVWCYEHAKALIFASHIEGFGLPLIEAMHYRLPVLASDIPIHHEVAGEGALYFSPRKPGDLCQLIGTIEAGAQALEGGGSQSVQGLTWGQSSHMLLTAAGVVTAPHETEDTA